MSTLRFPGLQEHPHADRGPIPFPRPADDPAREPDEESGALYVIRAADTASRRMERLARELECFGYFDDDGDRPRAA